MKQRSLGTLNSTALRLQLYATLPLRLDKGAIHFLLLPLLMTTDSRKAAAKVPEATHSRETPEATTVIMTSICTPNPKPHHERIPQYMYVW